MKTYFATFITGLSQPILQVLKSEFSDVKVEYLLDGIISFRTEKSWQEIDEIGVFNNIFLSLKIEKIDKLTTFERGMEKLLDDLKFSQQIPQSSNLEHTLKVVFSEKNQMVAIDRRMQELVQKRLAPFNHEFWFIKRTEGVIFFGIRLTHHGDYEKILKPGELRPELCNMMVRLSKPTQTDIVFDPFAGSGAIMKQRMKFPYQSMYIGEIKPELVQNLKQQFIKENQKVLELNALDMKIVSNGSITTIITDPPWGSFEGQSLNLNNFYSQMISEFLKVLGNEGRIILLVEQKDQFAKLLSQFPKITVIHSYSVLVSGRHAALFQLAVRF
jgi:tRNA G10  N-methylase Trm11